MNHREITRRTMLKGLGTVTVGLPLLEEMLTPSALNHQYGFLWWLNGRRDRYPAASERAVAAVGAGGNTILVEPAHDLVLVARWLAPEALDDVIGGVIAAIAG